MDGSLPTLSAGPSADLLESSRMTHSPTSSSSECGSIGHRRKSQSSAPLTPPPSDSHRTRVPSLSPQSRCNDQTLASAAMDADAHESSTMDIDVDGLDESDDVTHGATAGPSGILPTKKSPSRHVSISGVHSSKPGPSPAGSPTSISSNGKSKSESNLHSGRQCSYCGSSSTPMWRHGPGQYQHLCNSCGVKWRRGKILQCNELRHPLYKAPATDKKIIRRHSLAAVPQSPSVASGRSTDRDCGGVDAVDADEAGEQRASTAGSDAADGNAGSTARSPTQRRSPLPSPSLSASSCVLPPAAMESPRGSLETEAPAADPSDASPSPLLAFAAQPGKRRHLRRESAPARFVSCPYPPTAPPSAVLCPSQPSGSSVMTTRRRSISKVAKPQQQQQQQQPGSARSSVSSPRAHPTPLSPFALAPHSPSPTDRSTSENDASPTGALFMARPAPDAASLPAPLRISSPAMSPTHDTLDLHGRKRCMSEQSARDALTVEATVPDLALSTDQTVATPLSPVRSGMDAAATAPKADMVCATTATATPTATATATMDGSAAVPLAGTPSIEPQSSNATKPPKSGSSKTASASSPRPQITIRLSRRKSEAKPAVDKPPLPPVSAADRGFVCASPCSDAMDMSNMPPTPTSMSFAPPTLQSLRTQEFATLLTMVPEDKVDGFVQILTGDLDESFKHAMVRGEQVAVNVMLLGQTTWQRLWAYALAFH
ncbi:hypothetical protein BC831DRAFT_483678 [Entophlyctis helioformis]|nr:hypothetical protein BC831DRAFT_483678 [Entophlyctis helioformis]